MQVDSCGQNCKFFPNFPLRLSYISKTIPFTLILLRYKNYTTPSQFLDSHEYRFTTANSHPVPGSFKGSTDQFGMILYRTCVPLHIGKGFVHTSGRRYEELVMSLQWQCLIYQRLLTPHTGISLWSLDFKSKRINPRKAATSRSPLAGFGNLFTLRSKVFFRSQRTFQNSRLTKRGAVIPI